MSTNTLDAINGKLMQLNELTAGSKPAQKVLAELVEDIQTLVQQYASREALRLADTLRCSGLTSEQIYAAEEKSRTEHPELWVSRFTPKGNTTAAGT